MKRFASKDQETESYRPLRVPQALTVVQGSLFPLKGENSLLPNGSVQTLRKIKLAAVKCIGLAKFGNLIPEAVKKLSDQLECIPNRINPELHFGIGPCSTSQEREETHTYYIAVEVSDFHGIPEDLDHIEIESNPYAVVRKDRGQSVGEIYSASWDNMQVNELEKASNDGIPLAYQVEIFYESLGAYCNRVLEKTEDDFVMDLCVPLEDEYYKPKRVSDAFMLYAAGTSDMTKGDNDKNMTNSSIGIFQQQQNMKYASHVMVVGKIAESQQYYKDVLGFSIDGEFVSREGVHFLFKENQSEGAVRPNSHIGVVLDTYIWVNDVDSLYEEFKSKGANIIFGPQDMEYNMRDLLIEDLNGYRLCFGSPINE